jgi:hypothetical protein
MLIHIICIHVSIAHISTSIHIHVHIHAHAILVAGRHLLVPLLHAHLPGVLRQRRLSRACVAAHLTLPLLTPLRVARALLHGRMVSRHRLRVRPAGVHLLVGVHLSLVRPAARACPAMLPLVRAVHLLILLPHRVRLLAAHLQR